MHEWSAEVVVHRDLARRLIGGQFEAVELGRLRLLAEGWDNTVWLADEQWVFRFPRREVVVPGIERELAVLPRLAGLLPLAIPEPVFAGRPADGFPWPFFGARLIRGRELERLGLWSASTTVRGILESAAALPPATPSAIVHGDLHIRHLLVDDRCAPTGVIDWIDVCRGDPAIDLSLPWSLLPADARPDFLAAYGPVSDDRLLRAGVLALFLCGTLAVYAHHEGMRALEREAIAGLAGAAA